MQHYQLINEIIWQRMQVVFDVVIKKSDVVVKIKCSFQGHASKPISGAG